MRNLLDFTIQNIYPGSEKSQKSFCWVSSPWPVSGRGPGPWRGRGGLGVAGGGCPPARRLAAGRCPVAGAKRGNRAGPAKSKKSGEYDTKGSRVITDLSTNLACGCLSSQIGRDGEFSTKYGRTRRCRATRRWAGRGRRGPFAGARAAASPRLAGLAGGVACRLGVAGSAVGGRGAWGRPARAGSAQTSPVETGCAPDSEPK